MRGRAVLIAMATALLAAAPAAHAAQLTLPTGCTHGGAPFRTHGPHARKRIAIGFDDGPSDYTARVLRVLRRFDAHATFFEIGQETAGARRS